MPETKPFSIPILIQPPPAIELYIRLAMLTVLIGIAAVIAGVTGALLKNYLVGLYRKWIYYLE